MVHGLPGAKVLRPEPVVPPGTSVRSSIACVHQGEGVPVTVIDGIRVTTLAHTLLDLLGHWPVDAVERAFDGALPSCPVHLSAPATATGRGARAHRRRRQLAHRCGVISPRG
jgi:hypothetical protein